MKLVTLELLNEVSLTVALITLSMVEVSIGLVKVIDVTSFAGVMMKRKTTAKYASSMPIRARSIRG